jgi:peptidoglycan/LPS O-acetylase OafA/YrhL
MNTIDDYFQLRSDNFLLLRIVAAVLVIYGHSFAIVVPDGTRDIFLANNWRVYSGDIAVDIFFVISGFMVSGSYLGRSNFLDYTFARLLRIVPGLIAVLVICALVFGPLLTTKSSSEYFSDKDVFDYILVNLQFSSNMLWALPGVFTDHTRNSINGSLWTLPAEMRMYFFVAVLGVLGILKRPVVCSAIVLTAVIVGATNPGYFPLHQEWFRLAGFFVIGILVQLNKKHLEVSNAGMLATGMLAYISLNTLAYPFILAISIAYFCFWFAYRLPHFSSIERWGDPSYGIYLWGWPMQQLCVHFFPGISSYGNFLIASFGAILFGYISWHFIEKPAIKLKRYLPDLLKINER